MPLLWTVGLLTGQMILASRRPWAGRWRPLVPTSGLFGAFWPLSGVGSLIQPLLDLFLSLGRDSLVCQIELWASGPFILAANKHFCGDSKYVFVCTCKYFLP